MTASKSRYIEFRPDEYIAGVAAKLTFEEQGMYWMICSLIMSHGGPIENDIFHISALGRMSKTKGKKLIDILIKKEKITENDGVLHQKRSENEVKLSLKRIEIAKENGAKGGRPRKDNNDLGKAIVTPTKNLTNKRINQEPLTNKDIYAISLKDGTDFNPTLEDLKLWSKSFPHVDFEREFPRMESWLDANPSKKKTRQGAKKFISSWLSRADNNSKPVERPSSRIPSAGSQEADQVELEGYGEPFHG